MNNRHSQEMDDIRAKLEIALSNKSNENIPQTSNLNNDMSGLSILVDNELDVTGVSRVLQI